MKSISSRGIEEERRFASTQEEADIRMLLRAGFAVADLAARGVQGTVVIRSPDTGVLVLAVNPQWRIQSKCDLKLAPLKTNNSLYSHIMVFVEYIAIA